MPNPPDNARSRDQWGVSRKKLVVDCEISMKANSRTPSLSGVEPVEGNIIPQRRQFTDKGAKDRW